jgi:Cdc6-like AAA superfamily ATPase
MADVIDDEVFSQLVTEILGEPEIQDAVRADRLAEGARAHLQENREQISNAALSQNAELKDIKARLKEAEATVLSGLPPFLQRIDPGLEPPAFGCMTGFLLIGALFGGAYAGIGFLKDPGGWHFGTIALLMVAGGVAWWGLLRRRARAIESARNNKAIPLLEKQIEELSARARESLKSGIRDAVRSWLSTIMGSRGDYSLILRRKLRFEGLAERMDSNLFVSTSTKTALYEQMSQMPCGTIGIAGPRGSGKTTLLKSLTGELGAERRSLSVFTSVPVGYEGRDFILHLFATLCRQVLADLRSNVEALVRLRLDDVTPLPELMKEVQTTSLERVWEILRPFSMALTVAGVVLMALAMLAAFPPQMGGTVATSPMPEQGQIAPAEPTPKATSEATATSEWAKVIKPDAILPWGVVFFCIGLVVWVRASWNRSDRSYPAAYRANRGGAGASDPAHERRGLLAFLLEKFGLRRQSPVEADSLSLARHALNALIEIKYQRSYTAGWTGALKLPVALESGASSASTLAETQRSLPEIVERYRQFVEAARPLYERIVICIDELDKLESDDLVFRFMNEVKALFGIDKCFYLVSVSDAAISDFERRGLNFSNAFDSALDTMIRVPYFGPEECRSLIDKRIIGLPQSFLCVLEAFSGGLPRDLIRVARELDAAISVLSSKLAQPDLGRIVQRMVQKDVAAKLFAIRNAVRTVGIEPATTDFLGIAQRLEIELDSSDVNSAALLRTCEEFCKRLNTEDAVSSKEDNDRGERRMLTGRMRELATYIYLMATMIELFVERATEQELRAWDNGAIIRNLTRARQDLRVQSGVAFEWISSVRGKIGMRPLAGWATAAQPAIQAP